MQGSHHFWDRSKVLILLSLAVVLGVPFIIALSRDGVDTPANAERLVIVTPHNEQIRYEFERAFTRWHEEKYGTPVSIDWRQPGGTSEIRRQLTSQYTTALRDGVILPDGSMAPGRSMVYDLMFGGGSYEHDQLKRGITVNLGGENDVSLPMSVPANLSDSELADIFGENSIGSGFLFDPEKYWIGSAVSGFGIIYNRDALRRLGIDKEPRQWADLADPRYFGQIAVCDPTKSGSMNQAFEMLLQQQMQLAAAEQPAAQDPAAAIRLGWMRGMRMIQKISANARYFTDTSQKLNIDVGMGDCAAGMSIDFYGRFQQENILERSGDARFGFHIPVGGTTVSADPVGLLRGARNRAQAEAFIEFVLSLEGQKLWNFEVGAPGGPDTFSLRRLPIRPELYHEQWNHLRSDPDFNPYEAAADFTYHREWTGHLFSSIRTIIRIAFIDVRPELVGAWSAIIEARQAGRHEAADAAEAVLADLSRISHDEAATTIAAALKAPRIEEVRLARQLSDHFRRQYLLARAIARGSASRPG